MKHDIINLVFIVDQVVEGNSLSPMHQYYHVVKVEIVHFSTFF